jgi:hypothetical protein
MFLNSLTHFTSDNINLIKNDKLQRLWRIKNKQFSAIRYSQCKFSDNCRFTKVVVWNSNKIIPKHPIQVEKNIVK